MLLANRNYNLFDDLFRDPFFSRPFENASSQIMKTDIHEKDGSYVIDMELPGYGKEDIKADLKRYTGSCNRSFYVGDQITQEDIKASFKDGILTMVVPKEAPKVIEEPKYIAIE